MSAEFWAVIAVGVALAGLQWRMYASLNGRLDRIETRLNEIDRRLARLEGQMELLLRGLHIEIKGSDAR